MTDLQRFKITRVEHTGFAVSSLEEAIRFWVEGLGAKLIRTGDTGGDFLTNLIGAPGATVRFAVVEVAGYAVELLEYSGTRPRLEEPQAPFDAGTVHLALNVSDLEEALARVAEFGWRAQGNTQVIATGMRKGTRVMYVIGPDGAALELIQPAPAPEEIGASRSEARLSPRQQV